MVECYYLRVAAAKEMAKWRQSCEENGVVPPAVGEKTFEQVLSDWLEEEGEEPAKEEEKGKGAEGEEPAKEEEKATGAEAEGDDDDEEELVDITGLPDSGPSDEGEATSRQRRSPRKAKQPVSLLGLVAPPRKKQKPKYKPKAKAQKEKSPSEAASEIGEKQDTQEQPGVFSEEGPNADYVYALTHVDLDGSTWKDVIPKTLSSDDDLGEGMVVVWPDGVHLAQGEDASKTIRALAEATKTYLDKSVANPLCGAAVKDYMHPLLLVPFYEYPPPDFEGAEYSTTRAMSLVREVITYQEEKLFTEIEGMCWWVQEELDLPWDQKLSWLVFSTATMEEVFNRRMKMDALDMSRGPRKNFGGVDSHKAYDAMYQGRWGAYTRATGKPAHLANTLLRSLYLPPQTQIVFLPRPACDDKDLEEPYVLIGGSEPPGWAVGAFELLAVAAAQLNNLVHFVGPEWVRCGGLEPVVRSQVRKTYENFHAKVAEIKSEEQKDDDDHDTLEKLHHLACCFENVLLNAISIHYTLQAAFRSPGETVYARQAAEFIKDRDTIEGYRAREVVLGATVRTCKQKTRDNDVLKSDLPPGQGLFSTKKLAKGTVVVQDMDYQLLWTPEGEDSTRELLNTNAFGHVRTDIRVGLHEGSFASKVNDFHGLAEAPNCQLVEMVAVPDPDDKDAPPACLFTYNLVTLTEIKKGHQLLVDYGDTYAWNSDVTKAPMPKAGSESPVGIR